jgi:hypothetical protein
MIEHYEFIDKKPDGTKERQLGATTQLYNKLSAEETNNIRAKLNEIIDRVNISDVPLFPLFALKFKGSGNLDLSTLEVGDIVHGFYSAGVIWDNATYDGGDPLDKANYTLIVTTYEPELFTSTGSSNIFTLAQSGMKAQHLFIDRGMRYKELEWDQSGQDIEVLGATLAAGKKIYIVP